MLSQLIASAKNLFRVSQNELLTAKEKLSENNESLSNFNNFNNFNKLDSTSSISQSNKTSASTNTSITTNRKTARLGAAQVTQENTPVLPVFDASKFSYELETNLTSKPSDKLSTTETKNKTKLATTKTTTKTALTDSLEDLNRESTLHSSQYEQPNPFSIDTKVLALISEAIASQYEILPTKLEETTKTITILYTSEVLKSKSLTVLAHLSNYKINWQQFTDRDGLKKLIEANYFKSLAYEEKTNYIVSEKISRIKEEFLDNQEVTIAFDHVGELSGENNKVKDVIGSIITSAVEVGATDIDIDNNKILLANGRVRSELLVKFRIDGLIHIMRQEEVVRKAYDAFPIVTKQLCGRDSTKHRDGGTGIIRATIRRGKTLVPVELRVQFMPSNDRGIAMSMRIQTKASLNYNLSNNGLLPFQQELLQRYCVEGTRGCTFISGSINRGKNCTLVALLLSIQKYLAQTKREKNIVLVENPSEFILDKIRQITLIEGKTYDEIIQDILRFNPDYIAIGEMRNGDKSGEMVIELANVGHPVAVTVHANSACEVPYRLVNLGIPRFKVVEALNIVTNQILVRKNCPRCTKERDKFPKIPEFKSYLNQLTLPTNTVFTRSTGKTIDGRICSHCEGTGFKGRTGVFEVLIASQEIKEIIFNDNFTSFKILRQALREGFQTTWHNGLRKAALGEIALSELLTHIPRPTPQSQGLDLSVNIDLTTSQEFDLDLTKDLTN